jgi:hypothetical protein
MHIPKLMSCTGIPGAEDEDLFCCLSSFAIAAEKGKHSWDSGLEEKSIQAVCSRSQLDSEQALCFPEPLMKLQDVCPGEGLNQIRVVRAFG